MIKKILYEYAVLFHDEEEGTQMIVDPTFVLGTSTDEVKLHAAREIEDKHAKNMDLVEVIIRPFR